MNFGAALLLPLGFAIGLLSGQAALAAIAFALLYGAGNGLLSITRGTLPLVLFDHRTYGALVGRLLVPRFLLSAVAPLGYALVIEHLGDVAALVLSVGFAVIVLAAAAALRTPLRLSTALKAARRAGAAGARPRRPHPRAAACQVGSGRPRSAPQPPE